LSKESMTDLDFNTFSSEYGANPEKQQKLYSYLSENKMTDLEYEAFSNEYFGDVKKKSAPQQNTVSQSASSDLASSNPTKVGSLESSRAIEFDRASQNFDAKKNSGVGTITLTDPNSVPKNLRLPTEEEFTNVQNQGVAPPTSQLRFSQADPNNLYSETPKQDVATDFYNTSGNIGTEEFNQKTISEIDQKIRDKDLDIEKPYLFFYNQ